MMEVSGVQILLEGAAATCSGISKAFLAADLLGVGVS